MLNAHIQTNREREARNADTINNNQEISLEQI